MSLLSKISWWGKRAVDQAVGVTSGRAPAPMLDGPRSFRLFAALLVIAFGLSGWFVWRTIAGATKIRSVAVGNTNATPIAELEKLRNRDTDGDGLSDYDELFVLHSSPYLRDSDSDGTSDKDEVAKGQDPNCPQGKSCTGVAATAPSTDAQGQLTPQFLRQALLASGVPQTTIDQLNDTELLNIYQQAVTTPVENVNNTNAASTPTLESLNNLSATEIRKLLIDSGIDQATLDKVDDTSLKQIFQQALTQENTNQ